MHLSDFVAKYFWGPLHAQEDALWSLDHAAGIEKAYCCFNAPARDFARFGQMILEGGTFMGDTILAPSLMAEALKPATYLNDEAGKPVDFYGFQIWIVITSYSIHYTKLYEHQPVWLFGKPYEIRNAKDRYYFYESVSKLILR